MGKSGKKIKSDRINTLRKQYDAFLEDDKKRKDRNEYILGRLEDMRSSSALVKIRYKEKPHLNDFYYSSRGMPNYFSNTSTIEDNLRTFRNKTNIQTDCITQQFEPSILREISKNYILIPKLQSCISSGEKYLSPLSENDTDWKSKYNILNELKKSEKETITDNKNVVFEEQHKPVTAQESINKQENKVHDDITPIDHLEDRNVNIKHYDTQSNKSNSNTNEADLLDPSLDFKSYNKGENNIRQIGNSNEHIFSSSESNENDQYSVPVKNVNETEIPRQQFDEHMSEISTSMGIYKDIQNKDASHDMKIIDTNWVENQSIEKSDQEKFDNDAIIQENRTEEYFEQDVKEKHIANTEKNDHELTNNDDIHVSEKLQEGLQNNNETEPKLNNIQNYESNEAPVISDQVANAEVNELENEQNQMFYTDNTEKQYDYQENGDTVGYTAENESYTADRDQYSYHNEIQQEQPYTAEINEHEESTERYDPNYEQQYADNNYENITDVPQYDNQQYEVDNSYQNQQDPLASNVNYEGVYPNNENFERMPSENIEIPYQNQEENVYNYGNENYESQQYVTNEQQEYSTTDPNHPEQYVPEQEYIQMHTEQETIKDMEKGLDSEEGYIDNQNTILMDNTENTIIPGVSPDETESSLKAS